ncbi:MAG TPA: hypothetical protein VFB31_07460 [Pseudolabrys sp.]|nr:hypothetical protein [Pseudolabrys sp.]
MGRIVVLGVYMVMVVGGVLTLILQVLYFPPFSLEHAAISLGVALAGVILLWADFLR